MGFHSNGTSGDSSCCGGGGVSALLPALPFRLHRCLCRHPCLCHVSFRSELLRRVQGRLGAVDGPSDGAHVMKGRADPTSTHIVRTILWNARPVLQEVRQGQKALGAANKGSVEIQRLQQLQGGGVQVQVHFSSAVPVCTASVMAVLWAGGVATYNASYPLHHASFPARVLRNHPFYSLAGKASRPIAEAPWALARQPRVARRRRHVAVPHSQAGCWPCGIAGPGIGKAQRRRITAIKHQSDPLNYCVVAGLVATLCMLTSFILLPEGNTTHHIAVDVLFCLYYLLVNHPLPHACGMSLCSQEPLERTREREHRGTTTTFSIAKLTTVVGLSLYCTGYVMVHGAVTLATQVKTPGTPGHHMESSCMAPTRCVARTGTGA